MDLVSVSGHQLQPDIKHGNCIIYVHANWNKKHGGKVLKNIYRCVPRQLNNNSMLWLSS